MEIEYTIITVLNVFKRKMLFLESNINELVFVTTFHICLCAFLVRDIQWSPSYQTSCQLEARCLKRSKAGAKTEGESRMAYERGQSSLLSKEFKSPTSSGEITVRYLNDRPAIDALRSSVPFLKVVTSLTSEEERTERDEYTNTSSTTSTQDGELRGLQFPETLAASASTCSSYRLDVLKRHHHDAKLEKLKERIRKQWEQPEDLSNRSQHRKYDDHPLVVAVAENKVTPKVRKVATAPPAPSYKGTLSLNLILF